MHVYSQPLRTLTNSTDVPQDMQTAETTPDIPNTSLQVRAAASTPNQNESNVF